MWEQKEMTFCYMRVYKGHMTRASGSRVGPVDCMFRRLWIRKTNIKGKYNQR
jgi:hypothetical protein